MNDGARERRFYHLLTTSVEQAAPRVLAKLLEQGRRAVVLCASAQRLESLNSALWTYHADSFLPHGGDREGRPERQPIWLTCRDENPNGAQALALTDGAEPGCYDGFDSVLDFFDGRDPDAVAAARDRWRVAKAAGWRLTYFRQTEQGWERKEG